MMSVEPNVQVTVFGVQETKGLFDEIVSLVHLPDSGLSIRD